MTGNIVVMTPDDTTGHHYPTRLFLAGSIENGKAEEWQKTVINSFKDYFITVYNPRRAKWDPELTQSFTNEQFNDQVVWEQKFLDAATHVLMNFCADTYSPISLLELGQLTKAQDNKTVVVVCPENFWRRGNIEMVCILFKIPLYKTLEEGIAHLKTLIKR